MNIMEQIAEKAFEALCQHMDGDMKGTYQDMSDKERNAWTQAITVAITYSQELNTGDVSPAPQYMGQTTSSHQFCQQAYPFLSPRTRNTFAHLFKNDAPAPPSQPVQSSQPLPPSQPVAQLGKIDPERMGIRAGDKVELKTGPKKFATVQHYYKPLNMFQVTYDDGQCDLIKVDSIARIIAQ